MTSHELLRHYCFDVQLMKHAYTHPNQAGYTLVRGTHQTFTRYNMDFISEAAFQYGEGMSSKCSILYTHFNAILICTDCAIMCIFVFVYVCMVLIFCYYQNE